MNVPALLEERESKLNLLHRALSRILLAGNASVASLVGFSGITCFLNPGNADKEASWMTTRASPLLITCTPQKYIPFKKQDAWTPNV
jgi:hypothetical protein